MNKLIITVFNTEENAFEGLTALKNLDRNGDISLFATAVINKDNNGEVEIKQVSDKGPIGTTLGLFTGAVIGLFAGPVGMFMGATAGMFSGMFYDMDGSKVNSIFAKEVSNAIESGKTAVIADVDEAWTAPIDTKMEELDAMVFRKIRAEATEEEINRELDINNSEIDELEHDLEEADDDATSSIRQQLAKAIAKNVAIKNAIEKREIDVQAEYDAKRKKLNEQLEKAGERKTKKIQKRLDSLNASYKTTKQKLEAASSKASKYIG